MKASNQESELMKCFQQALQWVRLVGHITLVIRTQKLLKISSKEVLVCLGQGTQDSGDQDALGLKGLKPRHTSLERLGGLVQDSVQK